MRRRTSLTVGVAALVLSLAGPAYASEGALAGCGKFLATDAYLDDDLHCEGVGLVLAAGATLDLRGHTLSGDGTGTGVRLEPGAGSRIERGTISGWGAGVSSLDDGTPGTEAHVERVVFDDNVTGLFGQQADYTVSRSHFVDNDNGITMFFNAAVAIDRSEFTGNGTAISQSAAGEVRLRESRVTGNQLGLTCSEGLCRVEASRFRDNRFAMDSFFGLLEVVDSKVEGSDVAVDGTFLAQIVLRDSEFSRNVTAVSVRRAVQVRATDNLFKHNGAAVFDVGFGEPTDSHVTLTGNTFRNGGDGVVLENTVAALGRNRAYKNSGYGIFASVAVDLGGNVAYKNGIEPQCTGVACSG